MRLTHTDVRNGMLGALHFLFPPRCIACGESVASDFGLCAVCWRDAPFISGLVCDTCGTPLPGSEAGSGAPEFCDDCLRTVRPWDKGRAAMLYKDTARRLVIAFKHGDRLDLQRPLGEWVAHAAAPLLVPGMLVAPVPLHRWRLLKRRYNQSALLAQVVANKAGLTYTPDLLQRTRSTPSQLGRNKDQRFENISGAIHINPKKCAALIGRAVLIVDDVLTSGATLAACANACRNAGAETVSVVVLARVAKDA